MITKSDWAQEIIGEMVRIGGEFRTAKCCTEFARCYAHGDSLEACERFERAAVWTKHIAEGGYVLHIFDDGSAYSSIERGIDRFYPDAQTLAEQYEDSDPDLAAEIRQ